jgi:hypothetical protein
MEQHRPALISCKEATTSLHHKARKRWEGGTGDGEGNDKNERKNEDDRIKRRRR